MLAYFCSTSVGCKKLREALLHFSLGGYCPGTTESAKFEEPSTPFIALRAHEAVEANDRRGVRAFSRKDYLRKYNNTVENLTYSQMDTLIKALCSTMNSLPLALKVRTNKTKAADFITPFTLA